MGLGGVGGGGVTVELVGKLLWFRWAGSRGRLRVVRWLAIGRQWWGQGEDAAGEDVAVEVRRGRG